MKQQAEIQNTKRRSIPPTKFIPPENSMDQIYENEIRKKIKLNNSTYEAMNKNHSLTHSHYQYQNNNNHLFNPYKNQQDAKQTRQYNISQFPKNFTEDNLSSNKINFYSNADPQRNLFQSDDELNSDFIIEEHELNYWEDLRQNRSLYGNCSLMGKPNNDEYVIDFSGNKIHHS